MVDHGAPVGAAVSNGTTSHHFTVKRSDARLRQPALLPSVPLVMLLTSPFLLSSRKQLFGTRHGVVERVDGRSVSAFCFVADDSRARTSKLRWMKCVFELVLSYNSRVVTRPREEQRFSRHHTSVL